MFDVTTTSLKPLRPRIMELDASSTELGSCAMGEMKLKKERKIKGRGTPKFHKASFNGSVKNPDDAVLLMRAATQGKIMVYTHSLSNILIEPGSVFVFDLGPDKVDRGMIKDKRRWTNRAHLCGGYRHEYVQEGLTRHTYSRKRRSDDSIMQVVAFSRIGEDSKLRSPSASDFPHLDLNKDEFNIPGGMPVREKTMDDVRIAFN